MVLGGGAVNVLFLELFVECVLVILSYVLCCCYIPILLLNVFVCCFCSWDGFSQREQIETEKDQATCLFFACVGGL